MSKEDLNVVRHYGHGDTRPQYFSRSSSSSVSATLLSIASLQVPRPAPRRRGLLAGRRYTIKPGRGSAKMLNFTFRSSTTNLL